MPDTIPAPDYQVARHFMVDGQLRPSKVTDPRVIAAMRALPRENFVPPAMAPLAYIDGDVRLTPTRSMMKPLVLARLVQLAAPRAGEMALVVGAGSGYGAAILAACGAQVTALEEDSALCELAGRALRGVAGVTLVHGPLAEGWPAAAPYDLIVIEGSVHAVPERIGRQVAQTGRLVTVVAQEAGRSAAVLAEPSVGGLAVRPMFDAVAPKLPSLWPAPSFAF
ncbi:MAG: protein-L-isoaspartate O-methyltransferase [Rhodospirillales bacterium]